MSKKDLNTRIARWALNLQDSDYIILHRSGSQMTHVDALSRIQHLISSATLRRFINSKASRRSCIIMPPKRRAIGRSTPQARKRRALRASESDEQRALSLENLRVHATETRSSESSDQREVRLETNRIRTNQIRYSETTELRERKGCKMFE
ncbi:hypothetical protein TNCV_4384681 [Trichonephila clavipes]|nr:hypothetical protein TNCV_4384681 [Trichonephila clavipes]